MGTGSWELWIWHSCDRCGKPDQRVLLPVGVRLIVGRSPDVDVPVPSIHLGRRHFEVWRNEAGVWLADLGSLSGIWVNDEQIRGPTLISPCDTIRHANLEIRVVPVIAVDPSWLRWNDGTVPRMAQSIYDQQSWSDLGVLHDALMDAGCGDADMLSHARFAGVHSRGCWLIDLLLDKG